MDCKRAETQHVSRIVSIGGKGGVGKSMTTIAALDYLLAEGSSVVLVECDNAPALAANARVTIPWSPGYRSSRSSTLQESRADPPQRPDTSLPTEMGTVSLRSCGE